MRHQQLIEYNLNKHSAKQANKSTLVVGGAETQLRSQRISASSDKRGFVESHYDDVDVDVDDLP